MQMSFLQSGRRGGRCCSSVKVSNGKLTAWTLRRAGEKSSAGLATKTRLVKTKLLKLGHKSNSLKAKYKNRLLQSHLLYDVYSVSVNVTGWENLNGFEVIEPKLPD